MVIAQFDSSLVYCNTQIIHVKNNLNSNSITHEFASEESDYAAGIAIIASMQWLERVQRELHTAEAARAGGNEGMSRVCARRAAGWTVQAFLSGKGIDLGTPDVLKHFRYLLNDENLPTEARPLLEHLLQPKIKDDPEQESRWPLGIDLISETRQLVALLFPAIELNEKRVG
jgi:hypothetical protein